MKKQGKSHEYERIFVVYKVECGIAERYTYTLLRIMEGRGRNIEFMEKKIIHLDGLKN